MVDRREQILEAAAALVRRVGYRRTSVEDVIQEAGLGGKGHFYHYFRSKEELGHAVLQRQFDRFGESGLATLREPGVEPIARLYRFVDAMAAGMAEHWWEGGRLLGVLGAELAGEHERFRLQIEQLFEAWTARVEAVLWEARPRLVDDADVARLARFIVATLEGATLMAHVARDGKVMEGIATELKRFIATQLRDRAGVAAVPRPDVIGVDRA